MTQELVPADLPRAAEQASGAAFAIQGLPRIDRYFPECWCATVEAVSRLCFGVGDFGKIYGRHTFHYRPPEGVLDFRANGVELDVQMHRVEFPDTELESLIESVYGIRARVVEFDTRRAYWDHLMDSLHRGMPVVTDFDLGFVKARREYAKVFRPHVMAFYGYDLGARTLLAAEQMLATLSVDLDDFERCFEHKLATEGHMRVWRLDRVTESERQLSRAEVLDRIASNVDNLTSSDHDLGLRALARFREELAAYLERNASDLRPFSVPGLWVFSHERHIERKWLNGIASLLPAGHAQFLADFDALLTRLFKRWLNTDYLTEKCLASGNGKVLRSFPKALVEIQDDERLALDSWQRLQAIISSTPEVDERVSSS